MTVTATPIFPQTINTTPARIQNSDASNKVAVVTGGANGSKVESISVSSTDTSSRDINLYMTTGGVDYLICTVNIPANSGNTNAIVAVSLLSHANWPALPYDTNGNKYFYVANGSVLKAAATTTVTSAKIIAFTPLIGDF